MAWKSSFRQNYRTKFSPTFRRWDLSRRGGRGGTWWRRWERLNAGERNGKLPLNLAQDATYQSHTIRLTGLWSLPKPTQGLNTYKKIFFTLFKYMFSIIIIIIIISFDNFFLYLALSTGFRLFFRVTGRKYIPVIASLLALKIKQLCTLVFCYSFKTKRTI